MRLTSEIFVSYLLRRVFADGGFAAVERKGAEAAGAVFIVVRRRDGTLKLFGPAPQMFSDTASERRFMADAATNDEALTKRFEREARFDPDFWVVELETDAIEKYLTIVDPD